MATKEDVVKLIKEDYDDKELKVLQQEAKKRRDEKSKITQELVNIMKSNEIDSFDMKDGKIMRTKNVKSAISKTHLMESLSKYFKNDPSVKPEELGNFILKHEKISVKEEIRHKIIKNTD